MAGPGVPRGVRAPTRARSTVTTASLGSAPRPATTTTTIRRLPRAGAVFSPPRLRASTSDIASDSDALDEYRETRAPSRFLLRHVDRDEGEGWVRAIVEDVQLDDVPDLEGTTQNYRAARGANATARVLTATLRTVGDGEERVLPIVASGPVVDADATARREANSVSGAHTEDHTLAAPERGVLRFLPHQHIDAHAHGGTFGTFGTLPNARVTRDALELCHEYLCNCLRRGKHPDVLRQRRRRTVRAIPAGTRARAPHHHRAGSNPTGLSTSEETRVPRRHVAYGSDRSGLGMHQDFPDDDDYFDDDYFGRRDNPEDPYGLDPSDRATIGEDANDATPVAFPFLRDDFRARANRCFYGYEVSNPPLPLSPPPLADLELTPRVVEDLIARLDADAEPAYVTVTATGRSNGAAPPFYRARVYGRWPRGPRGASSVCEIALGLDDWLEDEPTPTLTPRERRIDIDVSSAIETSSSSSIIDSDGERRIAPMSSSPGRRRIRGVEDILALCASLKRGVPIYVARDVVDRFSVHPLGWRSSFHPSRADLERVDRDRRRRRSVDDASAGSAYRLHTPRNSDPDDPDLFDAFARFFVNERNRPGSTTVVAYGEHARGNLRAGGYAPRDGAGGVTRVARMLLLGPVAFFCLVVHAWTEWRRRWHGFPRRPSLAAQTGKHGNLARAAHRRATLPDVVARRRLDCVVSQRLSLAVAFRVAKIRSDAAEEPNHADLVLAVVLEDLFRGADPDANRLIRSMRHRIATEVREQRDAPSRSDSRSDLDRIAREIDERSCTPAELRAETTPSVALEGLERAVEEERWADAATLRDALRDMNARSVDHRSVFRGDETDDDPGDPDVQKRTPR